MSTASNARNYPLLANPQIQLHGPVDNFMYENFKSQLANCHGEDPLVVSITTLGGDPEMARAMGDSIRLLREYTGRETLFLGKVAVTYVLPSKKNSWEASVKSYTLEGPTGKLHFDGPTVPAAAAADVRGLVYTKMTVTLE